MLSYNCFYYAKINRKKTNLRLNGQRTQKKIQKKKNRRSI